MERGRSRRERALVIALSPGVAPLAGDAFEYLGKHEGGAGARHGESSASVRGRIVRALGSAVSVSFRFGLILAAPFVAVSLLYNLALGVINRAMPQLMVAFVGAPAITFAALLLLALTAPLILSVWVEAFQSRLSHPLEAR